MKNKKQNKPEDKKMVHESMRIIREVKQISTSTYIRLGKEVKDRLGIYPGAVVEAEVKRVQPLVENERYVIHCDTPIIFKEDEDVIDCPICGKELHVSDMEVRYLK
jgi:hypothetical protein